MARDNEICRGGRTSVCQDQKIGVRAPYRHIVVQPDTTLEIAETPIKLEPQPSWRVSTERVRPRAATDRDRLVLIAQAATPTEMTITDYL